MLKDKPLPTNEAEWEQQLEQLNLTVPAHQAELGLSAGDLVRLNAAAVNFAYLRNMADIVEDAKQAFTTYKRNIMNGPETGNFEPPVFTAIVMPELAEPGIIPWTRNLIQRIKNSTGFTQELGEEFGLLEQVPDPFNPGDIVPELKLKALIDGKVEIKFSKQGLAAMKVFRRKKGESAWADAGTYTNSPGIDPATAPGGEPEAFEYRGILLDKNEPVTQYSPVYTIVTNP